MNDDGQQSTSIAESTGWCLIPPTILTRQDLSLRQKFLMGRILGLLTPDGYCYASNAWLGAQLGITKGTIANLLSDMTRKGIIAVKIITNDAGQVLQRHIYPILPIPEGTTPTARKGVFTKSGGGIHEIVKRSSRSGEEGSSRNREVECRDKRVEKRVKAGDTAPPPVCGSLFDSRDTPVQTTTPHSVPPTPSEPVRQSVDRAVTRPNADSQAMPPYLPRHFPPDHPVCQVLERFAARWRVLSGQILDVALPRAIKEIQTRLTATPVDDLLALVDLWFDPGLAWVTEAERGSFHTFIQPRPISELKGLRAGLSSSRRTSTHHPSTQRSGGGARHGYTPPTPRAGWSHIPSGKVIL